MKPNTDAVRVLHVASFQGNLGDSAMHDGAYRTRGADCPRPFAHTPLEVRDFFHWGKRRFDEAFVDYLNTFDLAIFGGLVGFELWRDDTISGMRFDIAPELLTRIRIPVLFHGLGCDATRGMMRESTRSRCRRFLDIAYESDFRFSLRNDGSRDILRENLGADYIDVMPVIADGGLFADPQPARTASLYPARKLVAINLAGDMADVRFSTKASSSVGTRSSQDAFVREICGLTCALLEAEAGVRVVFVPHLHADLGLIVKVLEGLPDEYRRRHVSVAPCLNGGDSWFEIFDIYRQANLVIGMRFHACVVAVGQGTPTLGISTHHKVQGFFTGLQRPGDALSLDTEEWSQHLTRRALELLRDPSAYHGGIAAELARQRQALKQYHEKMWAWHMNWVQRIG